MKLYTYQSRLANMRKLEHWDSVHEVLMGYEEAVADPELASL